ncbi:MAG: hypothetical protein JST04_05950 [Bdellovibrionales bacterium]|nr:hypothetical protein [Bdellovibrionales bacterium]
MKRSLVAILGLGLLLGSLSARADVDDDGAPMDSLSAESADLAAAILADRAIPVGEPVSPAERTRTLAKAALRAPEEKSEKTETPSATSPTAPAEAH